MINCVSVLKVHLRVSIEIWKDIRNPANGQYGEIFMEKYGYDIIHDAFLNSGKNGQRLYLETGILKYGKGKADTEAYTGKRRRLW